MDVDRGREQQPDGDQQPKGEGNDRPFLYIYSYPPPTLPHAEEDIGVRPVPASVCWYLCSGIQSLTPFEPGEDLTVQVSVGNWQGGNSASVAYVGVWWSKPVSGPVMPEPSKFIGFSQVAVPPHGGRAETSPVTARIPAGAGNHICLLAKVWHPLDNVADAGVGDPVNDRHWAQHNLTAMPASPPQPFAFLATNPTDQEATYQIDVRPMPRELWGNLPTDDRLRPVYASAWLSLTATAGAEEVQGQNALTHTLTLGPREQREMELLAVVTDEVAAGTFVPFQIAQYRNERPVGGIAVLLRGS
ncbi:hypothetical protein [Streptomyces sp. NPDC059651]|uniref:hypothetical protein n=1 Tax=Streptomyces sp. NPDC059651 TaxID=3346897 RepID=UPI0036C0F475